MLKSDKSQKRHGETCIETDTLLLLTPRHATCIKLDLLETRLNKLSKIENQSNRISVKKIMT